ncbi:MAG: aminotransferase class V-fold PLP-dependent enzyme [Acidobacteria bacterium]|nr:aminotransferase class V-fold PLP-dependent enzyme [Acidobacteriota bacterium]
MAHTAGQTPQLGRPPLDPGAFDLGSRLWVMHCADGPIPRASARAVEDFLVKELGPWHLSLEKDFCGIPLRVKEEGARLLGALKEDLTLTSTTTTGLALVAQGFPWRSGDEVVVPLGEFPANAWPWRALDRRGVAFREVALWEGHRAGAEAWRTAPPPPDVDPEAALLAGLSPNTRVLAVSWVRFQDGLRLDLGRLAAACQERGVVLAVDGIQGAGTLPLDLMRLEGIGAFATGGHKGLLAPQGLGLLWTSPKVRISLSPPGGWLSVEEALDFGRPSTDLERAWAADGSKLEAGVPNLLGAVALEESLSVLNAAGPARIAAHVAALQASLLAELAKLPEFCSEALRLSGLLQAGRLGPILGFHQGGRTPRELQDLLQKGFDSGVFASVREGYLRLAFHGWHREEDLDRILSWLSAS